MDWITDQIAIGNYIDAQSLPPEVTAVLCLRDNCCAARDDVDALSVPLVDGAGNDWRAVAEATDFVAEIINAGGRILVHCHAGRSRSVVVVARYLMQSRGLSSQAALDLIAGQREIFLSPGIEDVLIRR